MENLAHRKQKHELINSEDNFDDYGSFKTH